MMLQQLFGSQLALPIRLAIAVVVIGALLAVTVLVMRRLTSRGRGPVRSGRAGPRLAVLDSVAVDQRRRLVLVRRDEVEHLLLVGGSSDIVVEHQIAVEDEAPAAAPAPAPAIAASREAPALQRPAGRRGLPPAALAAESVSAPLPAPEPAPAVAMAPPAPAVAPAPLAEPREDRRPLPSRRPLLRGDNPAPAPRPSLRPAVEPPAITPPAAPAYAPRPAPHAPLTAAAPAVEPEAVRPAAVEARKAPEIELAPPARLEPAPIHRMEPSRSEAPAPTTDRRLDELTQRLDAALAHPEPVEPTPTVAEPQLSLADLLGEAPEKAAEPEAAPQDAAPKVEPRVEHKSEAAPEAVVNPEPAIDSPQVRPSDRPLSRFLYQSRSRPEPRGGEDVRPRLDPLPRIERPSEDGVRPAAPARSEPPLRPREFAFRPVEANPREPATREAPALDAPRREPPALREITREPLRPIEATPVLPRPGIGIEAKSEAKSDAKPEVKAEIKADAQLESKVDEEVPARPGFIPSVAPKAADALADTPAPAPEPKAKDPLDDFDAEMADLLGRSSARGH
ncbi:flagellar biosynthetic protein FliO [Xanthobacter versatilis]|uniref:flagellar biosynthetic protein FliO n=1 Tax=Xanthobacter autotrophicus (strain ATCC BAA-1158 / Py2) TaxID=78245 RepID=UPI00372BD283